MFTIDQLLYYAKERPDGRVCLGKAMIVIYTSKKSSVKAITNKHNHRHSIRCRLRHQLRLKSRRKRMRKRREQRKTRKRRVPGCPKNIATDVERILKDRVFSRKSKKNLLWTTLSVIEENCSDTKQQETQKLTISFWCQSGMMCFKPTEKLYKKNCVEVAIFGLITLALKEVESRRMILKVDSEYMTDLSPCYVCRGRLPEQKRTLKENFRSVKFSYSEDYVIPYEIYEIIKRPNPKVGFNELFRFLFCLEREERGLLIIIVMIIMNTNATCAYKLK